RLPVAAAVVEMVDEAGLATDLDPVVDAGNPGLIIGLRYRPRAKQNAQGQSATSHPCPSHCPTFNLSPAGTQDQPQSRTLADAAPIRADERLTKGRAHTFFAEPQLLRHSTWRNLERSRGGRSSDRWRQGKRQVYLALAGAFGGYFAATTAIST